MKYEFNRFDKEELKEETKAERKERLDIEWAEKLPCATCHEKMKRLCKFYNTFRRPDYPQIFSIDKITCQDKIDPEVFVAANILYTQRD